MKLKRIAQVTITGLFLCVMTIASQKYTDASEHNTTVQTIVDTSEIKQQTIITPEDYKNMFSFYMPVTNPIVNNTNNATSDNTTDQTSEETDTSETSATDTTASNSQSTETNEESTPEPATTSGICEKDGYVDDHWISDINAQLAMIPSYLITEFQNDGWHIYCTDMDIDSVYYGGRFGAVMGTTNYYENRILIENREMAVTDAVIHEMGHWLDWHNGTVTDSSEFLNIYYSETDVFKSTFGVKSYYDQKELFAEAFWRYIISNQQLASSCPQLYDFMSRYI